MKKLLVSIFAMLLCAYHVSAQGGPPGGGGGLPGGGITSTDAPIGLPNIVPATPDAMAFMKYGEIPVGHYTGVPNISIPIYTITTKSGVQVPINISYHASGIKVDEKASRAGLGWSLSSPGIVSKNIIGMEDNGQNYPLYSTFNPNAPGADPLANTNYLYALGVTKGDDGGNTTPTDSGYDIYSYSFLGRSGKFFIDKNNKAHTIPHDQIKIEPLSGDTYKITDEQGNVYEFNSFSSNTSSSSCPPATLDAIANNFSKSTVLTKITTYTGEIINFNYRVFNYQYTLGVDETEYFKSTTFANPGCGMPSKKTCTKTMSHGESVLSSITYGQTTVNFLYSDDTSLKINGSNIRKDFVNNHALRKVTVNYNSQEIKDFELQYNYFDAQVDATADNYRLKLTKVIDNGLKTHEFTYNETVRLPKRLSYSQDFWGFYNGKSNGTLIPSMYYGSEYLSGADRNVDTAYTQANILTKITYPTKGSTTFTYENNNYYDTTTSSNVYGGGLRIAKLTNNDGNATTESFYNYNVEGTTQSSGIKQGSPVFSRIVENPPKDGVNPCKYIVRTNSSIYPVTSDIGKYVGYTHVTERKVSATSNSRVTYKFQNFGPDFYAGSYSTLTSHPTDYSWKKGKLIKKQVFNSDNTLLFKEENTYTFNNHFTSTSSDGIPNTDKLAVGYSIRIVKNDYTNGLLYTPATFEWDWYFIKSAWVQLTESTKTNYSANDSLQIKTKYFYENVNHTRLTKTEITDSKGNTVKSQMYYPHELSHTGLINKKRYGVLLKTERFDGSTKLSTQYTDYSYMAPDSLYLPKKISASKGSNALEDRVVFHTYYDNGNVKEVSKKDGTHIVYIWGYHDTQPIAKIENATFTDIPTSVYTAIVNASNADTSASAENTLRTELAKLRNAATSPNLVNAQITTYTYDPLIGVTSITDPRGQTVFYLYDSFNRLQYVKDNEGNIVSENQYNYKN